MGAVRGIRLAGLLACSTLMVQSLICEEGVFVSPAFVAFPFVEVDAQTVFF